mgnify:CR=1 FL=1
MKSRHKKLALIGGALAIIGIIAALVLNALNSNIALYITPTEVAAGKAPQGKLFRIGGLVKVLPTALDLATPGADLITLVKPQFEADGPKAVGKKGVVKDPEAHAAAVAKVREWLDESGWTVREVADSPITGGDGNVEFLLWAQKA